MPVKHLGKDDIIAVKTTAVPPFHSATGYGRAIPTCRMVQLIDRRWRRVYVCCFSNASTAYIKTKTNRFTVIGPDAEERIEELEGR